MEAKLKTLRVADLRELLQKASVPIPAKSNKSDLIAKVLASPAALHAFENQGSSAPVVKQKALESSQGGQDDDLLAPPEEFDWGSTSAPNGGPAQGKTAAPPKSATSNATAPAVSSPEQRTKTQQVTSTTPGTAAPSNKTDSSKIDDEMEKRKKRAARFGIPLVEVKSKTIPSAVKIGSRGPNMQSAEDTVKLEARAARFGTSKVSDAGASSTGQKRARPSVPADQDEAERRKKRAERFSIGGETKAQA